MTLSSWLTVVMICSLGAVSPGPSLAVVVKNTLSGSRNNGLLTALGHGIGVGVYAFLCVTGLAILITGSPILFETFQILGALYLAWLGAKALKAGKPSTLNEEGNHDDLHRSGFQSGFLIAFFNPKIALFFVALFSQVVSLDSSILEKSVYAATASVIDGLWYVIVALAFSHGPWLNTLKKNSYWLDRVFGVLLIALAIKMLSGLLF